MANAKASQADGDDMCSTMQRLALARPAHEEEAVWRALSQSGLLLEVPATELDLGPELPNFPCLEPLRMVEAVAARGCMDAVVGVPWDSSHLDV